MPRKPRKKKASSQYIVKEELEGQIMRASTQTVSSVKIKGKKIVIQSNYSLIKSPKEELEEILDKEKVAYIVEALLWKNGLQKKVRISGTRVKANQGSNIVIINLTLVKYLTLDLRDVKELDNRVSTITTSYESDIELK